MYQYVKLIVFVASPEATSHHPMDIEMVIEVRYGEESSCSKWCRSLAKVYDDAKCPSCKEINVEPREYICCDWLSSNPTSSSDTFTGCNGKNRSSCFVCIARVSGSVHTTDCYDGVAISNASCVNFDSGFMSNVSSCTCNLINFKQKLCLNFNSGFMSNVGSCTCN